MKITPIIKKGACFLLLLTLLISMTPSLHSEAVRGPIEPGWNLTPDGYVNSAGQVIPGAIARGVDVSLYQGKINWGSVAADGITFAFIRYGSEVNGMDARFRENVKGANDAGIRSGVYIYSRATTAEMAVHEANLILNAIGDLTVSFPIAIDMENDAMKQVSKQGLTEIANAFCARIEAAGFHPMVYASTNWYANRMNPISYDKWVAQYNLSCADSQKKIWQATDSGGVNGISGRVDINFLFHDYFSEIISDGFKIRKGHTYFYKGYKMQTGWADYAGGRYFMNEAGQMQTGWVHDGTAMFYLYETGAMATGLAQIGESFYYFNDKGQMQTGMVKINGSDYMFNEEGKMQTGMVFDGTHTYYFSGGGRVTSSLIEIGEDVYYFDNKGRMQVGLFKIGKSSYYADAEGAIIKDAMVQLDEITHSYFGIDGVMVLDAWVEFEDQLRYFNKKGVLADIKPLETQTEAQN
jgi:glucan-binding YG repeat protein